MLFPNLFGCKPAGDMLCCESGGKIQPGDCDRNAEDYFSELRTISHPFSIISVISFYVPKWYHFHSNEARAEQLNTVMYLQMVLQTHPPFIDATRQMGTGSKNSYWRVESRHINRWFWVSSESDFCANEQPNEILHNHMAGL